jgi:hypothetical protein
MSCEGRNNEVAYFEIVLLLFLSLGDTNIFLVTSYSKKKKSNVSPCLTN